MEELIAKLSLKDNNNEDEEEIDSILNNLSPYFTIRDTKYGGRGCFATTNIPKGTKIHYCSKPVGSTITKPFKKEVCTHCFKYDNGIIMKHKISKTWGKETYSIYFCSELCLNQFKAEEDDEDGVFQENLLLIEKNYLLGLKKPEEEFKEPQGDLKKQIEIEWSKVDQWDQDLKNLKDSQRSALLPRIDESEYLEIKYVVTVLFNMYKYQSRKLSEMKIEMILFDQLQSVEIEKYQKYPYLLYSYINMYKFIKLTCTNGLQPFITPNNVRSIIGKNLSNAFGIWSNTTSKKEDKEFLGFAVYPSASFFNHSCSPNILKTRINQDLKFETLKDIEKGEEICISYGNFSNESFETRQLQLKEWFFDCGCIKCDLEKKELEEKSKKQD
ncbi:SET6 [Candida pseudojiufengensis]|uniref:SET6 n=1 Tax=Candida pseudojiufengensis TaxID=497109 RepID=UPI0022244656|nr:SET6 [Candida pseudojiufengensis]KAI5960313.1 SET6 [Candida pseudojiufengensis]